MFETETHFLASGEDELVEVVEDELEGLWVALVELDDLANAAGVERLVLYVTEVTENLLDFLLHEIASYIIHQYLSHPQHPKYQHYKSSSAIIYHYCIVNLSHQ